MNFRKDPDAILDYKFDWSAWLEDGETITDHTVTAATGLTVDSSTETDSATTVTAWLSGGTAGLYYNVTCHVVTSLSREDDRSIVIKVEER